MQRTVATACACALVIVLMMIGVLALFRRTVVAVSSSETKVTISIVGKHQCHATITSRSYPKTISCEQLDQCIDHHMDPASDTCLYQTEMGYPAAYLPGFL
jgi:hypothetical protein